jgi:hypothetical protein
MNLSKRGLKGRHSGYEATTVPSTPHFSVTEQRPRAKINDQTGKLASQTGLTDTPAASIVVV